MSKSSKKTRRKNNLAKKRRKAALSGMQLEGLEPRQLLTATLGFEGTPVSGVVFTADAENKAAENASGPKLLVTGDLTSDGPIVVHLQQTPTNTTAEASDFSLASTFVIPAADYSGGHTFDLLYPKMPGANGAVLTSPLKVANDSLLEGDEAVGISISALTYANPDVTPNGGLVQQAIHTIQDNEVGQFRIQTGEVAEGDSGVAFKPIVVEIAKVAGDGTLDLEPGTTVKVTVDDNEETSPPAFVAKTGTDYNAFAAQTVSFTAGQLTSGIAIGVRGDTVIEGDENINFTLTSNIGAGDPLSSQISSIGTDTVKIKDDEFLTVSFDKSSDTVREDNLVGSTLENGQRTVKAIATVTPGASLAADVPVTVTVGGTATNSGPNGAADYGFDTPAIDAEDVNGDTDPHTFTIPQSTTGTFTYVFELDADSGTRDDNVVEGTETATLTIGSSGAYTKGANDKYTLTIVDDEDASIDIKSLVAAVAASDVNEGDSVTFEVQLSSSTTTLFQPGIKIPYTLSSTNGALHSGQVSSPAAPGTPDYGPVSITGEITLDSNGLGTLTVPTIDNSVLESDENLTLTLGDIGITGTMTKAVTIKDNDTATASLTGVKVSAVEGGADAAKELAFKVVLDNASDTPTTITVAAKDTSTAGSGDHNATFPMNITIPAGETEKEVKFTVVDDVVVEGTESLVLEITKVTSNHGDDIGKSSGTITLDINDNDEALVTVVASDPIADEGNNDGLFTVQLRAPKTAGGTDPSSTLVTATQPITVTYNVLVSSTATPGAAAGTNGSGQPYDYQTLTGTVTIPAGQSTAPIFVRVFDDAFNEGDEIVSIGLDTITAVSGVQKAATEQEATVTIRDNDGAPKVSVSAPDNSAKEDDTDDKGEFYINLDKPSLTDVTVNFVIEGSATLGTDYNFEGGTPTSPITIPAGQTKAGPFKVVGISDNVIEGEEKVKLKITSASVAVTTDAAEVKIVDGDTATLNVARVVDPTEAPNGVIGHFRVTLDPSSTSSTTDTVVKFKTPAGAGRATRGVDYQLFLSNPGATGGTVFTGDTLKIPAGQNHVDVYVRGLQDTLVEGAEDLFIELDSITSGASSISLGNNGSLFVLDDDSATVSVTATDGSASENGDQGELLFKVSNANVTEPIVVNYSLTGTASPDDVVAIGTIKIPANTTTWTVPIKAIDDALVEGPETLTLTITGITSGLNIGNPVLGVGFDPFQNQADVNITDNEGAFVYLDFLSQNDKTAWEEGGSTFTTDNRVPIIVGLTEASGQTETIRFAVSVSGFTADTDAEFSPDASGMPDDGGQFKGDDFKLVDRLGNDVTGSTELNFVEKDPATGDYIYTLTIPFGQRENSFNLEAINEEVVEGTERIRLKLLSDSALLSRGYNLSSSRNAAEPTVSESDKVTIHLPDFDKEDHAVDKESDSGDFGALEESDPTNKEVVVTIDKMIEGQLDVTLGTKDGSASKAEGDYTLSGVTTFSFTNVDTVGATSTGIVPASLLPMIKANNDTLAESDESFQLTATGTHNNGGNVTPDAVGGRVDIIDNDFITITGASEVNEESGGGEKTIKFKIGSRKPDQVLNITTEEITADKKGTAGPAVGDEDFDAADATVTFAGGKVSGTNDTEYEYSVKINKDDVFEGDQQFRIRVSGAGLQDVVKVITIKDDDTVKISTDSADVTEGSSVAFNVTIDKAVEGTLEVPVSINGSGTAVADTADAGKQLGNADFETHGRTAGDANLVTFTNSAAGAQGAFTVSTYDNDVVEKSETIGIAFVNKDLSAPKHTPNGALRGDLINSSPGNIVIKDNDSATLEVSDVSIEGNEGGAASYTVKLNGKVQDAFTVSVGSINGAAIGGAFKDADFTFDPASLNFSGADGQTNTVTATLVEDKVVEADEKFHLKHTVNAGDANISTAPNVEVEINDNDGTTIQIRNEQDGAEGGSGSFVVGLKDGHTTDVDVFVSIDILGTSAAVPNVDYTVPVVEPVQSFNATNPADPSDTSGSMIVRIPAGQNSVTIPINMLTDSIAEPTEAINLQEVSVSSFDPAIGGGRAINSPAVNSADDIGTVNIGPVVAPSNPTPSNVSISGSSWNVGAYSLTNHTASTLPWVNLNQLHITYPSAPTKTPTLTLTRGATPTGGAITIPATAGSVSGNAVTFSLGSVLEDGHYKATIDGNTVITFSVLHGDVAADASNVVAGPDFAVFAVHFGDTPSTIERYDLDGDGTVLGPDFARFAVTFANSLAGHQPASAQAMAAAVDSLFAEDADDDDDDNLGV